MDLILASTSPYRRALVGRLGVPFRCVAPPVDEEALKAAIPDASPRRLAEELARAKAAAVAAIEPDAVVIGGDQVVAFDDSILGKPGDAEGAKAQLRAMSGRSHELITAIHVFHRGKSQAHTDIATLHFRPLTPDEVDRYVEADRPFDCAGSYKLEALGIAIFERIVSADHTAIVGIPLIGLTTILRSLGFAIP